MVNTTVAGHQHVSIAIVNKHDVSTKLKAVLWLCLTGPQVGLCQAALSNKATQKDGGL